METPTLNHPGEAGQLSPDGREGCKDLAPVNGASDAETRRDDSWYDEVARHLDTQGFCLCSNCLGHYCFGSKASVVDLASAICRRKGVHPLKIAHTGV